MLFERIESEGLAHYSYLIGSDKEAAVIDPRRDVQVYLDIANRHGYRIRYILETHRNEDYLVGSAELAARSGAQVWHADRQWDYQYGKATRDNQEFPLGRLMLSAMETPGHTPGSFSYVLREKESPLMVFTGDCLFAGEVGRVDLLGTDQTQALAADLFDSIFNRLLPLGDGTIVLPAHGAGSVCGSAISDRLYTTIGLERRLNPRLQYSDKAEFVKNVARDLEKPPYFAQMEVANLAGTALLPRIPDPTPLSPHDFNISMPGSVILDTRQQSFGAAHVPGSISIWLGGVSSFAGWFLPYDTPVLLVNETDDVMPVVRQLVRMGYDNIAGYLSGGILAWHKAGFDTESVNMVSVPQLCRCLDSGEEAWILDVRSEEELRESDSIPGAQNIHITQILQHTGEIPKDRRVFVFCGSGLRSMIAASLLQQRGWKNLSVVLGGFSAWASVTRPLTSKKKA
ncbi:MAG: rhodanese-like domain-containing protein [Dehalococcoidales bacterium]|nr:rhodanese-like domain-containing protein [Dehalococcoidales bacterium]